METEVVDTDPQTGFTEKELKKLRCVLRTTFMHPGTLLCKSPDNLQSKNIDPHPSDAG